ncbi:hypothetical protein [Bradyrhizobium sp. ORS 86]|uniref:hypothetical protein n=1 Tax=Bradyrhizobium sp. ORS 86 TaxID=1685970 RepID=UPI003890B7CE
MAKGPEHEAQPLCGRTDHRNRGPAIAVPAVPTAIAAIIAVSIATPTIIMLPLMLPALTCFAEKLGSL